MIRPVLAAALALAAGPALAQEPPPSPHLSAAFRDCLARAGTNTVQTSICAQREVGAQDDRLNKAYQQVMRQLAPDPAARTTLRDDERSWLKARDYACKLNDHTVDNVCVVMRTATRADELEAKVRF